MSFKWKNKLRDVQWHCVIKNAWKFHGIPCNILEECNLEDAPSPDPFNDIVHIFYIRKSQMSFRKKNKIRSEQWYHVTKNLWQFIKFYSKVWEELQVVFYGAYEQMDKWTYGRPDRMLTIYLMLFKQGFIMVNITHQSNEKWSYTVTLILIKEWDTCISKYTQEKLHHMFSTIRKHM